MPVLHSEALALPIIVERATQKPTHICNQPQCSAPLLHGAMRSPGFITSPWTSIAALFLTMIKKFARFLNAKNQAPINAFKKICLCLSPPHLAHDRGFCAERSASAKLAYFHNPTKFFRGNFFRGDIFISPDCSRRTSHHGGESGTDSSFR